MTRDEKKRIADTISAMYDVVNTHYQDALSEWMTTSMLEDPDKERLEHDLVYLTINAAIKETFIELISGSNIDGDILDMVKIPERKEPFHNIGKLVADLGDEITDHQIS